MLGVFVKSFRSSSIIYWLSPRSKCIRSQPIPPWFSPTYSRICDFTYNSSRTFRIVHITLEATGADGTVRSFSELHFLSDVLRKNCLMTRWTLTFTVNLMDCYRHAKQHLEAFQSRRWCECRDWKLTTHTEIGQVLWISIQMGLRVF